MNTAKSFLAPIVTPQASAGAKSNINTFLLFIVGFSLAGSGFSVLRFSFLGLRVHTYLLVVGAFFPLLAITRLHLIPSKILFELTAFASLYFVTTIPGGVDAGEGIKIFAAVATIVTMAMLVRSWDDFLAGVLGMCLAVGVLAVKGLESDVAAAQGIKALEEANRNTFSLYALPPILLGSYVLIRGRPDSIYKKLFVAAGVFLSALIICLNLNRSGWLGLGLIALMIAREKSWKAVLIVAMLGIGVYLLITTLYSTSTGNLESRLADTRSGLESDKLRWRLITTSFDIATSNPLFGVSPQELPFELAERMGYHSSGIAPHNVYAHIAAGCGLIALFLLGHLGWTLATWKPEQGLPRYHNVLFKEARKIMRLVLILWLLRGCFTHEIIYSPGFCMAIGLALGLQLSYVGRSLPPTGAELTPSRRR